MNNSDKSKSYKWFVLALLTIVYTFNFIDRQILVILAEPIKAELNLSDTQLGLLTGLAFAAFYVTLGIPIARFADMNNRKNVVAASLAAWSLMTAISGSVNSFVQLFFARMGVGIGEAGGSPPAHSMISDYFPPKQRATALSIYSMGIYIGILIGFVIGGVIAKNYGWRIAFYAIGIPGVLFAALFYFIVKEPIKGQSDPGGIIKENPTLKEVIATLLNRRTFILLAFASGFHAFGNYGTGNFMPSFLMRIHNIDIATIGYVLGLTAGIGGAIGAFSGGYFSDRFRHRDVRWAIWIPMLAGMLYLIPHTVLLFTGNANLAMTTILFTGSLNAVFIGPAIAVTHSLVNARMRAFASAILFFILNLIGLGFGPLVVGYLSDLLTPTFGDFSLRWAFCFIYLTEIISITLYYLAGKNYINDLKKVEI